VAAPAARRRPGSVRTSSLTRSGTDEPAAAAVFLVLRRMRLPLMVLVLVFAVSVLGLTLVPGQDAEGRPDRLSFFDAFYFMSYTATTIGFGELPYAFTDAQRLWVIVCIYSTVVAWAYAIGALLTLLQDRAFRDALALQHFSRKVQRLREPVPAARRLRPDRAGARSFLRRARPPAGRAGHLAGADRRPGAGHAAR
jgi:hypothetical protein